MQGEREKDRKRNYNYHKKNTKDSIPYDEKTGIVFVYTVWISPMMHSVVTRGVQYVFQRTQRFYILKKRKKMLNDGRYLKGEKQIKNINE